jgi:CBS domain-containing protein
MVKGDRRNQMVERQETGNKIREAMTPMVASVKPDDNLMTAAQTMRDNGIGDVVVLDSGSLFGLVTDRDIVVRGIADGRDPQATPVGEIASRSVKVISPDDDIDHAVEIMRKEAVRRLPVVEDGRVIGVLSLGDLAVLKDPGSALGEISAAPPTG